MRFKPDNLRLHPLRSIKPGAVVQIPGRADDIPYAIKLQGTEGNESRILLLGGEYPFEDANWNDGDQLAIIVCEADNLLVELGSVDEQNAHSSPGGILVYEGGAVFNAKRDQRYHTPIDLSTWDNAAKDRPRHPAILYSAWTLGYLNEKSDFITVFTQEGHQKA